MRSASNGVSTTSAAGSTPSTTAASTCSAIRCDKATRRLPVFPVAKYRSTSSTRLRETAATASPQPTRGPGARAVRSARSSRSAYVSVASGRAPRRRRRRASERAGGCTRSRPNRRPGRRGRATHGRCAPQASCPAGPLGGAALPRHPVESAIAASPWIPGPGRRPPQTPDSHINLHIFDRIDAGDYRRNGVSRNE